MLIERSKNNIKFKLIPVVGRKGTTTASGDLEGNIFTNQGKEVRPPLEHL
jgi:hypothetical protein